MKTVPLEEPVLPAGASAVVCALANLCTVADWLEVFSLCLSIGKWHFWRAGNDENCNTYATIKQRNAVPASTLDIWTLLEVAVQRKGAPQHRHLIQGWSPARTLPASTGGAPRPVLLFCRGPKSAQ